jgi:uncharacterized protein YqgV (UPF0045/DUF77 family)
MRISLEISMYPLDQNYIPPIQSFIDALNEQKTAATTVSTNGMSTQVFGPFEDVMQLYQQCVKIAMEQGSKMVFVSKLLSSDVSEYSVGHG